MNAPFRATALLSRDTADLAALLDDGCTVAILARGLPPAVAAYTEAAAREEAWGGGFRLTFAPDETPYAGLLPDLPGREAMAADLGFLATLYADLVGCPRVGLRLEVTAAAMCPRFHADRVGVRLLCTYRGPGTEWIDPAFADPAAALAQGGVRHAERGDIVMLKGDAWPGNAGRGALHRSPDVPVADAPRVLAAIDAIW